MKRFQSRIESLRRLRQQAEKLARMQAAVQQQQKMAADQQLHDARQQLDQLLSLGRQVVDNGNTAMIQAMVGASARAEAVVRIAETLQRQAVRKLSAAQMAVGRAKKDVRIADSYRERELADFRRGVRIQEENERDESNGRRFAAAQESSSVPLPTQEAEAER